MAFDLSKENDMKNKVFLFIWFWVAFSSCAAANQNQAIEKIKNDPFLELYLPNLFYRQDFGYALIGAKALSIDWLFDCTRLRGELRHLIFGSDKFIFKESAAENDTRIFILINKQKFTEVFLDNRDIFINILGSTVTSEKLLNELETSQRNIVEILDNHLGLLGILLGYGRENSLLYARRDKIRSFCCEEIYLRRPTIRDPRLFLSIADEFTPIQPEPSFGFNTIEDEQKWFRENFAMSATPQRSEINPFDFIIPVGFRAKPGAETDALMRKYKKSKEAVTALFYGKDPVDVVCEQLMAK